MRDLDDDRVALDDFNSVPRPPVDPSKATRKLSGAQFAFEQPEKIVSLWGRDDEALWTPGEALMIVGPDGVGKTTLIQRLWLARAGLADELLGLPVARAAGVSLYLAMDRPAQAARSLRRMVTEEDAPVMANRLAVWKGPLPVNPLEEPTTLADWIAAEWPDATDVFFDSLKDLAPRLDTDEPGSKLNLARQELLARGLEVVEAHHQRKATTDNKTPKKLADVYGSRWLVAGTGSVLLLWGEPGDAIVELRHLKQPAEEFGPHKVLHDHRAGRSELYEPTDLLVALERSREGMLVADAARAIFETGSEPSANQIEKARRKLNGLVEHGHAHRQDDLEGTARYFARSPA